MPVVCFIVVAAVVVSSNDVVVGTALGVVVWGRVVTPGVGVVVVTGTPVVEVVGTPDVVVGKGGTKIQKKKIITSGSRI